MKFLSFDGSNIMLTDKSDNIIKIVYGLSLEESIDITQQVIDLIPLNNRLHLSQFDCRLNFEDHYPSIEKKFIICFDIPSIPFIVLNESHGKLSVPNDFNWQQYVISSGQKILQTSNCEELKQYIISNGQNGSNIVKYGAIQHYNQSLIPPSRSSNWQQYVSLSGHYILQTSQCKELKEYIISNGQKISKIAECGAIQHYNEFGSKFDHPYHFDCIEVIVNSGRKTASASLFYSFVSILPVKNVLHVHYELSVPAVHRIIDIINQSRKQLLMVSCYREPISRHLSSFFQHMEEMLNMNIESILKLDASEICQLFIEHLEKNFFEANHPFSDHFKHNLNDINIFSKEFNKTKGFQIYETEKLRLIFLRFDKISHWESIIRENTQYKNFRLFENNLTSQKTTAELYKKVCNQIVIPKKLLDNLFELENDNLEYFYTTEEIQKIKQKYYR
jgi:hypothetical protein